VHQDKVFCSAGYEAM